MRGSDSEKQRDDAPPSVERRFLHAELSGRLFGTAMPARVGEYELLRRAGAGGMGLVFEAREMHSGQHVALKVLRLRGASALQRMKREFRTLSGLHHPHLVQLYQLSVDGEHPFLTMELVQGASLLDYVAPDSAGHVERVHGMMVQLVAAVSALHGAGFAHRDLKPANVLIDRQERLVVVDFGSACALGEQADESGSISGTPLYLAPERLRGVAAAEAADWYGVGMILAEALGVRLRAAADGMLDRPSVLTQLGALAAEVPGGLVQLVQALVDEEPARRPDGAAIRAHFGIPHVPCTETLRSVASEPVFVGRERELEVLRDGLHRARSGAFTMVHVSGAPGIGKSALVSHFLGQLTAMPDVLVLKSRCYEREFIAYNAVDGVIDALAERLAARPEGEWRGPELAGTRELLRLFPALRRALPERDGEPELPVSREPERVRQRAFGALRALLHGLATQHVLVLHLDDLQWADTDSAHLLQELLRAPAPAPLLLIASYRAEAEASRSLRALHEVEREHPREVARIVLGSLEVPAALQLASALCGRRLSSDELVQLTSEASGSPLFLRLLVQHRMQSNGAATESGVRLQSLLLAMLQRLSEPAQRLLQLAALAGGPIDAALLLCAGELSVCGGGSQEQVLMLQTLGLLRRVQAGGALLIDTYHDRLREIVRAAVPPGERPHFHAWLVEAASWHGPVDAEFLAIQCEGATWFDRAARYAEQAGDGAFEALALQRSVRCYEQALRCLRGTRPRELVRKLAEVSACMGRTSDVAALYLELTTSADPAQARGFRMRAAELLIRGGRVPESIEVVEPLLEEAGLTYPRSLRAARRATLDIMTRIAPYVLDPPRTRRAATELEALRIDVCFSLGYRMVIIDPVPAGVLLLQSLELALECGSDEQLARVLAAYALMLATMGFEDGASQSLLERATELAEGGVGSPATKAIVMLFGTFALYTRFRPWLAFQAAREAQHWIGEHLVDSGWLLQELDMGCCGQLAFVGDCSQLAELVRPAIQRALEAGNSSLSDGMVCQYAFVRLAQNDPFTALRELKEVIRVWKDSNCLLLLGIAMWAKVHALLYLGQGLAALAALREHSSRLRRAGFRTIAPWTIALPMLRGEAALASAIGSQREKHLRIATRSAAMLRKRGTELARPMADLIEAGVLRARGQLVHAATLYGTAADAFDAQHVIGYAACARARQAELLEPDGAGPLFAQASRYFTAQGIVDPGRWTRAFAPAPWDPDRYTRDGS